MLDHHHWSVDKRIQSAGLEYVQSVGLESVQSAGLESVQSAGLECVQSAGLECLDGELALPSEFFSHSVKVQLEAALL
eukprot:1159357-Pelagomonas_calceolata.AAC.1